MKFIGIKNIMRETGIEVRSVKVLAGVAKTLKSSEILACFHRQKLESVSLFISAEGPLKLKETRRTTEDKCLVRIVKYDRDYETFLRHELGILVPAVSVDITGTPAYTVEFQKNEAEEEATFQQRRKETLEKWARVAEKQKESVADFIAGNKIGLELEEGIKIPVVWDSKVKK